MRGFTNLIFFVITFLSFFPAISFSSDTLNSTQSLKTKDTLLSANQTFVLGFFSSDESRFYLGIWYKNIQDRTVVWVANRDNPLEDPNGFLKIGDTGNMEIVDGTRKPIWSSNQTAATKNPVLQILDSGNLIIRESSVSTSKNPLWQSFDYPTNTLLPGMKLVYNFDTKMEKHITSWKSSQDPSTEVISFKLDFHGLPEIFLWNNNTKLYRSGPWNGVRFSGVPEMKSETDSINFDFYEDEHQLYYTFNVGTQSLYSRLTVTPDGHLQRLTWVPDNQVWTKFWFAPKDQCDSYKECGPYGICDTNASPVCTCMRGFSPKNTQAWNLRDGSDGCVRKTKLDCGSDEFCKVQNVKLPDTTSVFANRRMSLMECEGLCKKNCSCTAYANIDINNGGSGCVMWTDELVDMRVYTDGGQDLYVRLAASDVAFHPFLGHQNSETPASWTSAIVVASLVVGVIVFYFAYYLLKIRVEKRHRANLRQKYFGRESTTLEHLQFSLATIEAATNKFSHENRLGRGGFGQVFKGVLPNGEEIAVKRLSEGSGQGAAEFKNEVLLIARLQHRNLVALLGFCVEEQEKLLVYEYVPNRSLDYFLFGSQNTRVLDWMERSKIIGGVARGILYLHEYSRLKIIHRDLKPSNILLDNEMNPKISDFGLAKMVGVSEHEGSTNRIVGTYGYMSPEYAMFGQYSEKSDVFSFGVIVLEIISRKKKTGSHDSQCADGLLSYTWKKWRDEKLVEILDSNINELGSFNEVIKCIQIGLLCVQENPNARPSMATIVSYLSNDSIQLPIPQEPAFFLHGHQPQPIISNNGSGESCSVNEASMSEFFPR